MPWTSAQERAAYDRNVKARRCVKCRAGLLEDDGVRCGECEKAARDRAVKYLSTERGKTINAARSRRWRAERKAAGECRNDRQPVAKGRSETLCERCCDNAKVATARYLDRKEAACQP